MLKRNPRRKRLVSPERRLFLYSNAWALAIAALAVISAIAYFLQPDLLLNRSNSIGTSLGVWAYLWNALYLAGGLGILIGLILPSRALDMAGLCFMAGALIINGICVLFARHGAAAAAPALFALAVAAMARLRALYILGKFNVPR